MTLSVQEKRQIENELIFRQANEAVTDDIAMIDIEHVENNNPELTWNHDLKLEFICECSDENCRERISLTVSTYQDIHTNRHAFILKPGHEVKTIEEVVTEKDSYAVVRKNVLVTEPNTNKTLNTTVVDNS